MIIYEKIYEFFREIKPLSKNEVITLGILGYTGSGKTEFSKQFANFLYEKKISAIPWNCDIYTKKSRKERDELRKIADMKGEPGKRSHDWMREAYSSDKEKFIEHLEKIKKREGFLEKNLINYETGEKNRKVSLLFQTNNIIISYDDNKIVYEFPEAWFLFDGGIAREKAVKDKINFSIFLETNLQTRMERVKKRCLNLENPFEMKIANFLEADSREHMISEDEMKKGTNIIINNEDFNNPKIIGIKK